MNVQITLQKCRRQLRSIVLPALGGNPVRQPDGSLPPRGTGIPDDLDQATWEDAEWR